MKPSIDLLLGRLGMTSPKILTHHVDAGLEQIQRRAERVDKRLGHPDYCSGFPF